jgi:hypothetical protein
MIDPDNWPLWLRLLAFTPLVVAVYSFWTSLSKNPKWRRLQIGCMIYAVLFGIFGLIYLR